MIWLRVESNFAIDPRHGRLARRLDIARPEAVCYVITAICWTAQFHETGDLSAAPAAELAEGAGWSGDAGDFVQALYEAGWLIDSSKGHLTWADWVERQQPLLNSRERLRRFRESQHAQQLGARPAGPEGETFQKRSENASETVTSQPASRSTTPQPPLQGGRQKPSRRPSRRQREADDLLQLGAHRPVQQPDEVERCEQDIAIRDEYRAAAERATAAGDVVRAIELRAKAHQLDQASDADRPRLEAWTAPSTQEREGQ